MATTVRELLWKRELELCAKTRDADSIANVIANITIGEVRRGVDEDDWSADLVRRIKDTLAQWDS